MQCSRCHTDVPEGSAFCPHCGQAVPLDPPAQTPEVRDDGPTARDSSADPDDVHLALLLEARSLYRSLASMEVLETVCPLILLLSFVPDIGRIFGAVYVFLILIILIWSQSLTRRTAEYFEHTGHDTWSRLVWKIRRLCQFQLGAVAGSFIVSLLVALMSRLMGDSFKDLALVLGVTFGIPLLAAVFYSLYGAIFCFFSIFSVRDAIFISAEEIPMRGINPLVRDFAVAITALVFIVSLVACVSMFLP